MTSPACHGSPALCTPATKPAPARRALALAAAMLVLATGGCEQRTVTDPGAVTRAAELGLKPRTVAARGSDYAARPLVPGVGIGDIRLGDSTLADVERLLGTDYEISSLVTSQQCGPDGCRDGPVQFALEYRRLALTVGFERAPAGTPAEQSRVRLIAASCPNAGKCAFRGATDKGLRIGDGKDRARELHGDAVERRGSGNLVFAEGLVVASARGTGTLESLTVFRRQDIRQFQ
jgi:hypothetical protein